ncbi:transforming growth factor beta activator LRRC33-like [Mantella aurantiaca]
MICQRLSLHSVPPHLPDGIRKLDLSYNFIQNLTITSVSQLHKLEDLDLHANYLEDIEDGALDVLSGLESLNLASNRLDKRSASHRGKLDCLRSLRTLDLARNNLDGEAALCYISNITSLLHLDLSRNAIVLLLSGMFDGVPQLSALDLSHNFIDEIQGGALDSLKGLRVLNLAANAIRCVSDFDLPQLHVLNLSSNIVEFFLAEDDEELYQLTSLDLSRNRLIHFPLLTKLQMVEHLNLSGNYIRELVPSSNATEENMATWSWYDAATAWDQTRATEESFSQSSNVMEEKMAASSWYDATAWDRTRATEESFSQSSNVMEEKMAAWSWYDAATAWDRTRATEEVFSHLSNVRDLDLSDNRLTAFPWNYLSKMPKLNNLSLAGNCLQDLAGDSSAQAADAMQSLNTTLPSLKVIDFHANSIHFIPQRIFHFLPGIKRINLEGNNVGFCSRDPLGMEAINQEDGCSNFSGAPNLRYLNLRRNGVARLPPRIFEGTPLASLDLSHNPRLDLQGKALEELSRSLQELSVQSNGMSDSQMDLPCLRSLKSLDLSGNRLSRVPFIANCSSVESLDLRNNSLKTLNEMTTSLWKDSLRSVSISGNPLDCCSRSWLDLLLAAKIQIWDLEESRCGYAESERRVSLNDTSYRCGQPTDDHYIKVAVIVLSGSFALLSLICYVHKKRDGKFCTACWVRSSKVTPETPDPTKSRNAQGKQVCFTVSRDGLD